MQSFEQTKIAMAVLATLTFSLGLSIFTGAIYEVEKPQKPAFSVAIAGAQSAKAATAAEAPAETPIAELLAKADAKRGETAFRPCTQCHTPEKGGPNKAGPNLWDVYGGVRAHLDGFKYSDTLQKAKAEGLKWDAESLNKFIANPRTYVPGTAMAFAGVKKETDRADIIAYLRSLSDSPKP